MHKALLFINFAILFSLSAPIYTQPIVTYTPTQLKNLESAAQNWLNEHVILLPPDDIQLIANALYLSYSLSLLDGHVRQQAQETLNAAWELQQYIAYPSDNMNRLSTLQEKITTLQETVHAHNYILNMWQSCTTYIETLEQSKEQSSLVHSINELQNQGRKAIQEYLEQKQESINASVEETKEILCKSAETFQLVAQTYQALINGDNPLLTQPDNELVAHVDIISRTGDAVTQHAWHSIQKIAHLSKYEAALQEVVKFIFVAHYKVLYDAMQTMQLDAKYMTLMFDEAGIIPEEQRIKDLQDPSNLAYNLLTVNVSICNL